MSSIFEPLDMLMKKGSLLILFLLCAAFGFANDSTGVIFSPKLIKLNDSVGLAVVEVKMQPGIKLYSTKQLSEDAPFSEISFPANIKKTGSFVETGSPIEYADPMLETRVRYLTDSATWQQPINLSGFSADGEKIHIQYFIQKGDEYLPYEEDVLLEQVTEPAAVDKANLNDSSSIAVAGPATNEVETKSLLWIFLTAFAGGLLALLTPCVYSMIPITVSFFTKRSKDAVEGRKNAIFYALSIVTIFTIFGFLITLIFGPAALNNLSTNWVANLVFFVIFLVFGISFLGAFDINLPSSLTNKVDSKAGMGSKAGIFFMALTLVLVSFSCTGPIIGNLLVLAAKGNFYGPLIGMFGFSLALALPFALFAFFPSKLSIIGKAGGWLNSVKVTLGFLELALALKFLSNADLAKGWRLLDRELYLALWIVIFLLLTYYLLGRIKFHHDDELPKNDYGLPYLSVTRLFFAIASFAFAVYLVPGLWGAPLKAASPFLPPMGTQDFILGGNSAMEAGSGQATALKKAKYAEKMHIYEPEVMKKFGLHGYFDFNEAKEAARDANKPLMLDFTGINCVNCRKMEAEVWSHPEVMKRLKNDFVIASLYVDVHNVNIPKAEQYKSEYLGKNIETLGDYNTDLQVKEFGANTQPYYFFLDNQGKRLKNTGYGYDPDVNKFISLLDEVKAEFEKRPQ